MSESALPSPTVSVLMATCGTEQPERLARALESIFGQTLPPDQMVLVLNGPVPDAHHSVTQKYKQDHRIKDMCLVPLNINVGLGPALNAGLEYCTGEWIMRMDSGDESQTDRAQTQIDFILEHPEVDLVGGWSEEFSDDSSVTRIKSSPVTHDAIVQALKWRNVLVHPSTLIRTEMLRSIGGYRSDFVLFEDWDLYVRLLLAKAKFAIIPKVLIRMLVGKEQARRGGGLRYLIQEARFRTFCWSSGFINLRQYAFSTAAYTAFRLARAG